MKRMFTTRPRVETLQASSIGFVQGTCMDQGSLAKREATLIPWHPTSLSYANPEVGQ